MDEELISEFKQKDRQTDRQTDRPVQAEGGLRGRAPCRAERRLAAHRLAAVRGALGALQNRSNRSKCRLGSVDSGVPEESVLGRAPDHSIGMWIFGGQLQNIANMRREPCKKSRESSKNGLSDRIAF